MDKYMWVMHPTNKSDYPVNLERIETFYKNTTEDGYHIDFIGVSGNPIIWHFKTDVDMKDCYQQLLLKLDINGESK